MPVEQKTATSVPVNQERSRILMQTAGLTPTSTEPGVGPWGDQGDRLGFYCWNDMEDAGHPDTDWFRYEYDGPRSGG